MSLGLSNRFWPGKCTQVQASVSGFTDTTPARPQNHRHAAWGGERWMLLVGPVSLNCRTPNTPPTTKGTYISPLSPLSPLPPPSPTTRRQFLLLARQGQPRPFSPHPISSIDLGQVVQHEARTGVFVACAMQNAASMRGISLHPHN